MSKLTVPEFRLSFPSVFTPSDYGKEPRFQITMLWPTDTNLDDLKKAIVAVAKEKFPTLFKKSNGKWPGSLHNPLRDGDEKPELDGYEGMLFARAKTKSKPGVLGPDKQPIEDPSDLYAGCWCIATVTPFAFENESKGVGLALGNIMKMRDDEPFGDRTTAEDDFADIEATAVDESEGAELLGF